MFYFKNTGSLILKVTGRHARSYLNSRLTNSNNILESGQGCLAAQLNAKGSVEGLFSVSKLDDCLILISDNNDIKVLEALKRYIVSEEINFEILNDDFSHFHLCLGDSLLENLFEPSATIPEHHEGAATFNGNTYLIRRRRSSVMGVDAIVNSSLQNNLIKKLQSNSVRLLSSEHQRNIRFASAFPCYPEELNEGTLLTESLDRRYTSTTKNKECYLGQEVIEKIYSRGETPMIIYPLSFLGSNLPRIGEDIVAGSVDGNVVGKVLSTTYDKNENTVYIFGRLKNDSQILGSRLYIGGVPVFRVF